MNRLVAHKNDGKGLIQNPVILIAESDFNSAEDILKGIPEELNPIIIQKEDILDNKYIKSWCITENGLEIDMESAKITFKDRVRMARVKKFQDLDVKFQRALETNSDTSEIVSEKQKLRDLPENPKIDECKTTEDLDNLWLEFGFESF